MMNAGVNEFDVRREAVAPSPVELLSSSPMFSGLSDELRDVLARGMRPRRFPAGSGVVRKGDRDKTVFIISSGTAEVLEPAHTLTDSRQLPDKVVARLGAGDSFGEMALLLDAPRSHTVRAATDLLCFTLDEVTLTDAFGSDSAIEATMMEEMLLRQVSNLLAERSPFASLDQAGVRWVARTLRGVDYPAGAVVLQKGDAGDAMFIVQTGSVEVVDLDSTGAEIRLALLGPGEPFGERALLTDEPRSASVRTIESSRLLRLDKTDFDKVLGRYADRRAYFTELMMMRERPQRIAHWVMEPQEHVGRRVYVLKDIDNLRYLRLSEAGAFVWRLMDGSHSVRDITLSYVRQFHRFGMDIVLEAIMQLHASHFVELVEPKGRETTPNSHAPLGAVAKALIAIPVHYFALPDVDRAVAWLYRNALWVVLTRPVQALLLLLATAGAIEFVLVRPQAQRPPGLAPTIAVLLAAVALYVQVLVHELGHAVTCKHFGREVHRAGLGWYYFLPVAFVDTSDIWLSSRRDRILVSAAGPYVNFVLSGLCLLAVNLVAEPTWRLVLIQLTVTGYALAVLNLNPLVETDGYYVLMDWLDIPNLRNKALQYLGTVLRKSPVSKSASEFRRLYVLFGALILGYTVLLAGSVLFGYRTLISGWVSGILSPSAAGAIGWALAALVAALMLARVAGESLDKGAVPVDAIG